MSLVLLVHCSIARSESPVGPYFGQSPPGLSPKIFAPDFISTGNRELNSAFTPDGSEFYFARRDGNKYSIWLSVQESGHWSHPVLAPMNSEYSDVDVYVSNDGQRLYWGSTRPINNVASEEMKLWYVERMQNGWGEPTPLEGAINKGRKALYPSITLNGTMYFQGKREGGYGGSDIYRSEFKNGIFQTPKNVGAPINSKYNEGDVLIAPDESYMIVSMTRPDDFGSGDLYVSFRTTEGMWSDPINMGPEINSNRTDFCPMLSPDGKYLFFSSTKTGNGDIYWVDAQVIDRYR